MDFNPIEWRPDSAITNVRCSTADEVGQEVARLLVASAVHCGLEQTIQKLAFVAVERICINSALQSGPDLSEVSQGGARGVNLRLVRCARATRHRQPYEQCVLYFSNEIAT